jgi:magnesium chelatase subunit I
VSARLTIAAYEAAVSSAERRAIIHDHAHTQVWISDLSGIIPAITGKIELVYEGEQEGPYEVALNLLNKSIRTIFVTYFPNPDQVKKKTRPKKSSSQSEAGQKQPENPYAAIEKWFDTGNQLDLLLDMKDEAKIVELYKVDGLFGLVKKYFPKANEKEAALLMEFVLHGLASYSIISKKMIDGKIEFNDMMGGMINLGDMGAEEEGFDDYV